MKPIRLGISPCPNDTFIFGPWALGLVSGAPGVEVEFHDVQRLNELALAGALDLAKVSYGAWPLLRRGDAGRAPWRLLRCGGALGMGCGPLLLRSPRGKGRGDGRVFLPGEFTTAARLFSWWKRACAEEASGLAVPPAVAYERFDRIYKKLLDGEIEWGVVIHECRFTYERDGLERAADLGDRWERKTGAAIPLGGIVLRGDLADADPGLLPRLEAAIRASIAHSKAHREELMPWIFEKAGIPERAVVDAHIDTYVNAFSEDLGETGLRAVETLCGAV